ncbi:MAG: ABC transporter permease [Nitrospinota bacterium]|nr:MAG: ABC transporter permease [Nitrospinota bacterium]
MGHYLIRRFFQSCILMFIVTVVTFAMILSAPGGPSILLDPNASAEDLARMRRLLGLDDPIHVQYFKWIRNVAQGNLGVSYNIGRPVLDLIRDGLPATLVLAGSALLFAILFGISLGILSAVRRYSLLDHLITVISFFGLSVPVFWYGLMLIMFFAVRLRWLPAGGMFTIGSGFSLLDRLRHLLLPMLVLGTVNMAQIVRYTRSSMLTVLQQDYIKTARSKGIHEARVLYKHALKNACIPVVTIIGLLLPRLVGGAAVTETVFSWPGMGRLAVSAAFERDYPTIMGITLAVSAMVILSNLLTDILYVYLNPRIRYE